MIISFHPLKLDMVKQERKLSTSKEKGVLKASRISDGWWRRFLARNPSISLRSGDATANVRMEAVNERNITAYFNLLKEVYDELELSDHIPNAFITWMKQECRLSHIHQKLLPKRAPKKSDIVHPVRKLKLRSLAVEMPSEPNHLSLFMLPNS